MFGSGGGAKYTAAQYTSPASQLNEAAQVPTTAQSAAQTLPSMADFQSSYQAPPTYIQPTMYQTPSPNSIMQSPMDPTSIMQMGASAEAQLPSWLQLQNNPMSPQGQSQYANNYYQQNIAPQLAQAQAATQSNGQGYSSYGGANMGQMAAEGQLQKYNAGLDYAQQLYGDVLQGRQSYFSGGPQMAEDYNQQNMQNQQNVWNGLLNQAQMNDQFSQESAAAQNAYGLAGAQMNNAWQGQMMNYGLQSAQLGQQNNQFNASALNNMGQFNVGQNNQFALGASGQANQNSEFNAGQANQVSEYNAGLRQQNMFGAGSAIGGGLGDIFGGGSSLFGGGFGGSSSGGFGGSSGGASPFYSGMTGGFGNATGADIA